MPFNLSIREATELLDEEINEGTLLPLELDGIDNDTIFSLGLATALQRFLVLIGPDPMEVSVVEVPLSEIEHAIRITPDLAPTIHNSHTED